MRYFDNPNFNGIIFRRTVDSLRELKWKSRELYPKAGGQWREKDSQWVFPSGATMWLTYLDREEDVERYIGQSFTYIGWDELTLYATPFAYNFLRSRLRTTDPNLPVFVRATTNPNGVGFAWVKKMFVDPAPPNTAFPATDIETGEPMVWPDDATNGKAGQPLFYRRFIPAKLSDNPYLAKDGQYETMLRSLPEAQRRALLDGEWVFTEGAAFPEFSTNLHVTKPFDIPKSWTRFRACDYGYSAAAAVLWFTIDPAFEQLIVYRELYTKRKTGRQLAREILEIENEANESIQYGVLDSSVWHQRGQTGPSIAEEMISEGCRWRPSDRSKGSRANGKNRLHELLKLQDGPEGTFYPGIKIFNNCRQLISDLPMLPTNPNGEDDIDQRYPTDHTYDALRYGIMSRPRSTSLFEFNGGMPRDSYRPADSVFGY